MVMRRIDMSVDEYMELKKQLSEELVGKHKSNTKESVKALSETFDVPEEEAFKVLQNVIMTLKKQQTT